MIQRCLSFPTNLVARNQGTINTTHIKRQRNNEMPHCNFPCQCCRMRGSI
ncbi:hypothetical protein DUZ37_09330 [Escherichia coli]|nr:hypothetical protein [Escherichia coli]